MSLNYQLIGRRIAKCRKKLNLTQSEVEERADIGQKYMSNIESGRSRASIDTLIKICHVLGCTPNEVLLGVSENELTDFTQTIDLKTKDMNKRKKQFLINFVDFLTEENL